MAHDGSPREAVPGSDTGTVAALFDPEPAGWGMRGDPHLWRALRGHLADTAIPPSVSEVMTVLHAAFRRQVGVDLALDPAPSVYREEFAHGGMSSGVISLDTWRDRLMPLLEERARGVLSRAPR